MKRNQPIVPAVFIAVLISGLVSGAFISCTQPGDTTTYKVTYGYKYYENPYFSLEYPSDFTLNHIDTEFDDSVIDYMQVEFTGWRNSALRVTLERPGSGVYINANEKFEAIVDDTKINSDNYTIDKMSVCGIQVDYLESFRFTNDTVTLGETVYLSSSLSFRTVVFDYAGFIWEISMYLDSAPPEPSIIREDFYHIIETFKISETYFQASLAA